MLVTGVDTGEPVSYCTIDAAPGAIRLLGFGQKASAELEQILLCLAETVAIERPTGFYPSRTMLQKGSGTLAKICEGLLQASWSGGEIKGMAIASGRRVVEVSAPDARRAIGVRIGGRRQERTVDQQIADIVPRLVQGWPRRSCVGVRDAAVAAIYGIRFAGGASS